jgi:hypothetical protein
VHTQRRSIEKKLLNPYWSDYTDTQLLDLRIQDLKITIERSELRVRIDQLYEELADRGLRFRPPCWLSSEWFSPTDSPGIAIPFYLAHPRLMRLEQRMMKDVEGGTRSWCMQLLRHEAGHAYETAYRLNRRKRWREVFGSAAKPYPDYYTPEPYSHKFVLHLDWWYAQSHPVEDFAETFAEWLRPNSQWRQRYKGWAALEKLECVDELMSEIAGTSPPIKHKGAIEPLKELNEKLREHYWKKQERYSTAYPSFYDADLLMLFPPVSRKQKREPASSFLRRVGRELPRRVASWTGEYAYTINLVLKDMIHRCRELDLRVSRPEKEIQLEAAILLTMQTMNYLHGRKHRLAV